MSDYFSGRTGYHHSFEPNFVTNMTFAFNTHYCFSDHFLVNGGEDHLHHRYLPDNSFVELPPPTTNQRIGTWGRGGAKAYFRFHGGIGDGCCGIACRNILGNAIARPVQLFDALDPIDFQNYVLSMTADGDFVKIPVTGRPSVLPAEASSGTGVFLPVYQKRRIRASKGMHVRGGRREDWGQVCGGRMKQKDTFPKRFVGGDVKKEECKDTEEVPIELLLPSEWTY
ncbi:hypothetical protein SSX86_012663 [Deinandra increscens subsp. villosa]|uniref:Uncharacterized protein n=1 Tax=Deinandra increscens subsp. villosa TaxID=3103831 RepID=A0AAP0GZ00_9ASTR